MKGKSAVSIGRSVALASVSILGVIMLTGAILGSIVLSEICSIENARIIMAVVSIGGVFIGAWMCAIHVPNKKLMTSGMVCGLSVILLLFLRSVLFMKCQVIFDHRLMLSLGAFLPAGLLASRKKTRRK